MSQRGGRVVTTALEVNANRAKVGKDGFYEKPWCVLLTVDVCTECTCVYLCVLYCVCMRACVASVQKWLGLGRLALACCQSDTLITVLTHSNTDRRAIANHTAVMSHTRVHKYSFYTLYREFQSEKPLAVSQAVWLLHLPKSPWREFVLVGIKIK